MANDGRRRCPIGQVELDCAPDAKRVVSIGGRDPRAVKGSDRGRIERDDVILAAWCPEPDVRDVGRQGRDSAPTTRPQTGCENRRSVTGTAVVQQGSSAK